MKTILALLFVLFLAGGIYIIGHAPSKVLAPIAAVCFVLACVGHLVSKAE